MRARLPARTIRLRLTLAYGLLFLLSGAALLGLTYALVRQTYTRSFFIGSGGQAVAKVLLQNGTISPGGTIRKSTNATTFPLPGPLGIPDRRVVSAAADAQSSAALHQLLVDSAIAFTAMGLLSIWFGWVTAGRALRPLRTITDAARDISASNLHRRLDLQGPDDELRRLGTTFDALLERLEASFEAQRQFVAHASHELRTPLTLERTLLEVALSDPQASVESLRRTCEQVLAVGEQQERLIEALLTLSRSQRGLDRREPVDLAAVAEAALAAVDAKGLELESELGEAATEGDPRLVERLVANLVGNAVRHNVPGGRVLVATATRDGRAVLTVENTGPVVLPHDLPRLFRPFERLDAARATDRSGLGLGLSIVDAIARAHDAVLAADARPEGGLRVEVAFPAAEPGRAETFMSALP